MALGSRHVRIQKLLWWTLIVLCAIGAIAVIRRAVAIAHPAQSGPAQLLQLDRTFEEKALLTLIHILPALILTVLLPFQFSETFRSRHLKVHRWMGRTIMTLGLVIGVSGLFMLENPVGGLVEVSAILFFDTIFLFSLARAFFAIRGRNVALHREWIIRSMSVLLGVATTRPVMGVFFATSPLTGMTPQQFFGVAFWIGFGVTYLAGEVWIRYTRANSYIRYFDPHHQDLVPSYVRHTPKEGNQA